MRGREREEGRREREREAAVVETTHHTAGGQCGLHRLGFEANTHTRTHTHTQSY